MHFMICIAGFSGVGKDDFCKPLIQYYKATKTGLADPAKRHMADIYGFTEEQLFGPSIYRNAGDLRYPKDLISQLNLCPIDIKSTSICGFINYDKKYWGLKISSSTSILDKIFCKLIRNGQPTICHNDNSKTYLFEEGDPVFWLSPREALQKYCELMNNLYLNTWIRKGIENHIKIASGKYSYDRMEGLIPIQDPGRFFNQEENQITCFADFRHWHEIRMAKSVCSSSTTPILVRVISERVSKPPYDHRSETEQVTIPDNEFNFVVRNNGTVKDLHDKANKMMDLIFQKQISGTRYL
jgi:hypothetical protein